MKKCYRVCQGSYRRWFKKEKDAKQFAADRYDKEFDGIPFIEEFDSEHLIYKLNELEARVAGEDSLRHAAA